MDILGGLLALVAGGVVAYALFLLRKPVQGPVKPPDTTPLGPPEAAIRVIEDERRTEEFKAQRERDQKIQELQEGLKAQVDANPTLDDVLIFLQDTSQQVHEDEPPPTDSPTKPTIH